MWGTDHEWRLVAIHFGIEDENPRLKLAEYINELSLKCSGVPDSIDLTEHDPKREIAYARKLMDQNGILEQFNQLMKELGYETI